MQLCMATGNLAGQQVSGYVTIGGIREVAAGDDTSCSSLSARGRPGANGTAPAQPWAPGDGVGFRKAPDMTETSFRSLSEALSDLEV